MSAELGGAVSSAPSLHHVALETHDVEGLASFYMRLLQTAEPRAFEAREALGE